MTDLAKKVLANMLCRARQCWEQGIAGAALCELGEEALLIAAADDMLVRQHEDGRLCTVENTRAQTDPALCMRTVMRAWQLTGDEGYLRAAKRSLAFYQTTPWKGADGIIYHVCETQEVWSDTAAMLPSSLAIMGEKRQAVEQLLLLCGRLRLENGLYGHIRDDRDGSWPDPTAWASGEGWILMGLAWTMIELGHEDPDSQRLLAVFTALTAAMKPWRTPEGLYHNTMDDESSFLDCSTAVMEAYSSVLLYEHGWLGAEVLPEARRVLDTVRGHIDSHGAIHDCPGSPFFSASGTSTEMQAFWLMLYAALERCTGKER